VTDLGTAETIRWERDGAVLIVTLHRPERLNALSRQLQDELASLWPRVREDSSIRVVVLTGAGRAFSAGADTADLSTGTRPARTIGANALNFCPARVLDIPVIVAINGMCVGGALNFLADADIAIAAEEAWFTDPHVTMGQVSGAEVLQLSAKASFFAVTQLALSGNKFRMTAARALDAGLLSEMVPGERLLARAVEVAQMIAAQSPAAIATSLGILRRRVREQIAGQLEDAWAAIMRQWDHPDAMEGPNAFLEKRPPNWAPRQT